MVPFFRFVVLSMPRLPGQKRCDGTMVPSTSSEAFLMSRLSRQERGNVTMVPSLPTFV